MNALIRDDYKLRRLLIRPGAIGDCILALPAMECLRAVYTEVWVPSPVVPLIRFADRVRAISATGIDLLGLPGIEPDAGLLDKLRAFDSIVSWYGTSRAEFRQTVQDLGLPFKLFLMALPDVGSRMHATDFFLSQAGGSPGATPRIPITEAVRPQDFILIHPFSGSAKKNWPLARYRELAARLPLPVQWCAGPHEELPEALRIESLYDLGRSIGSARLYIGNDSGITHLAAAVGTPVVAIFGPTDPAVWGPRGNRIHVVCGTLEQINLEQINLEQINLDQISVDRVLDAACSLLKPDHAFPESTPN